MINYKHTNDIRHGIVLKENGEPKVGIFHGSALPATVDDGGVPVGSLYIRTNGELHQKISNPTNWALVGAGGGSATDTTSASAVFTRDDTVDPQTWLKIGGKISSDKSGLVVDNIYTKLNITVSTKTNTTASLDIYKNKVTVIQSVVLTAQRIASLNATLAVALAVGDELSVKTNSGTFEDLVLFMRLLE